MFGGGTDEQFKEVFAKLDLLEAEIESAVGQISAVVQESELEEEHARISTYYSNLRTAAIGSTSITSVYSAAYNSFFSHNPVEVLDHINRDTQEIRDRLIGMGAIHDGYLGLAINDLYQKNTDIYTFNNRITAVSSLFQQISYMQHLRSAAFS